MENMCSGKKIVILGFVALFTLGFISAINAEDTNYFISIHIEPANGGTVTLNPSYDLYPSGSTVTLTALPNDGYYFLRWECSESLDPIHYSPQNPVSILVDNHKSITAVFRETPSDTYTLVIQNNPEYGGHITVSPDPLEIVSPTTMIYPRNTAVTLTATPNTGYSFSHFSHGASPIYNNPHTTVMNLDTSITAYYTEDTNILPGFELVNVLSILTILSIGLYFTKRNR